MPKKCLNSVSTVIVQCLDSDIKYMNSAEGLSRIFSVLWDLIIWWLDVVAELRVNLYGP